MAAMWRQGPIEDLPRDKFHVTILAVKGLSIRGAAGANAVPDYQDTQPNTGWVSDKVRERADVYVCASSHVLVSWRQVLRAVEVQGPGRAPRRDCGVCWPAVDISCRIYAGRFVAVAERALRGRQ